MQRILSILVTLAWGLWFGGILMVFIAVQSIFATFGANRAVAGATATGIFQRFEVYQLALAAGILLAMLAWRLLSARSRLKNVLLVLFAISTAIAMVETLVISSKIERLRRDGQTTTEEFKKLHGASMGLYSLEALVLLFAGTLLPATIFRDQAGVARAERGAFEPAVVREPTPIQPVT